MRVRSKIVAGMIAGLAIALVCGVSSAEAAKGVKKKSEKGEHKTQGVVIDVNHEKNIFIVKPHHDHKKKGITVPSITATPKKKGKKVEEVKEFDVSSGTVFLKVNGKKHEPSSFKAVSKGDHVVVEAKGRAAERVAIHHHKGKKGKKK